MSVSSQAQSNNSTPISDDFSPRSPSTAPTSPQSPAANLGFPQPPPVIMPCDDAGHCNGGWVGQCESAQLRICPGLANNRTPVSYHGNIVHPLPHQVVTCGNCRLHEDHATWQGVPKDAYIGLIALSLPFSGHRAQLCHDCIRDEMELYWQRHGTNRPQNPALSVHRAAQWPILPNQDQDLCICETYAIDRFADHCHACRDEAFLQRSIRPYRHAESILWYHTRPVVTGKKRCTLNGGTSAHQVQPIHLLSRVLNNFGRKCPCGNIAKRAEVLGQDYITICLGCMGVQITVANLPPKYQQANMQPRRRSPRGHALKKTKGPKAADRSARFRVNIERGWVPNDSLVGGT